MKMYHFALLGVATVSCAIFFAGCPASSHNSLHMPPTSPNTGALSLHPGSEFNISGNTLVAYKGSSADVTVPNTVKTIGKKAFYGNKTIKRITLPNGLEKIEEDAFAGTRIPEITIPKSVSHIEGWAFFYSDTEKIVFEQGSALTEIPASFCQQCKKLAEVTLPEKVESIGTQAFEGCESLATIQLPDSIHTIKNEAFRETALAQVTLPANLQVLDRQAFYANKALQTVSASNAAVLPEWKTVEPNNNGISSYCFDKNPELTDIALPGRLTHIKSGSFLGMKKLKKITLPASVTDIGERVSAGPAALEVHVAASDPARITVRSNSFFDTESGFKIIVPHGAGDAFKAADGWKDYKDYISEES
ncbi:MAG: leucine-rich repeat protein [Treponema sp.]|nr:leucine-rich repeat protein [Treponema sp.]